MRIVGRVDLKTLERLITMGLGPGKAVNVILDEARRRYGGTIIIEPGVTHPGYDIIEMGE